MATEICPWCGKTVDKFIMFRGDIVGCRYCGIHTKQTNADHIRSMTDEELAELFESWIQDCGCNNVPCSEPCKRDREREITDWRDALEHKSCYDCWLDWLRQEATDG